MKFICGGIIGLSELGRRYKTKFSDNSIFMINGRSCIKLIVSSIKPNRVWIPNYHCCSMLEPLTECKVEFYNLDNCLNIDPNFIDSINVNDIVLFVNYFGNRYDEVLGERVRDKGGWVLEDSCMGLFTPSSAFSHFVVRSIGKNLGTADGGIIETDIRLQLDNLQDPPIEWLSLSTAAREERRQFDKDLISMSWFQKSILAKKSTPCGKYRMSEDTKLRLERFDYDYIQLRQNKNWAELYRSLSHLALVKKEQINAGGFFPICVEKPETIRNKLFDDNIYPAIHWPNNGHWLSHNSISLPCDWRYDGDKMIEIADKTLYYIKELK